MRGYCIEDERLVIVILPPCSVVKILLMNRDSFKFAFPMPPPLLDSARGQTLDNTAGAFYLGVVGASFLFGVTSLQTYWYYHHYPRDSRLHKIAVGVLWALDSFHLILTIHAIYHYIITGFGDIFSLAHVVWSIRLQGAIMIVIILIVQSLYTFRVWLLGGYHHGILGYLVISVLAGGFVIGIVLTYEIYTIDTFTDLGQIAWAIESALAAATAIDFVISLAMCYYLRKSKGKESRLNSRISTMMQYTLSSGLFTCACSMSALVSYLLLPNTFVFLAIEFISTKLYANSFLAMLNARERPTERHDDSLSLRESHLKWQRSASSGLRSPSPPPLAAYPKNYIGRNNNANPSFPPVLHVQPYPNSNTVPREGKAVYMYQWES